MRRTLACLVCALLCAAPQPNFAVAQPSPNRPPHAWLFGSWTGGLFPSSGGLTAEACLSQPVVIFTTDVVLRATLLDSTYEQRVVETARTTKGGAIEFHFAPTAQSPAEGVGSLVGTAGANTNAGFGCGNPDVLHVQRRSDNEIVFPGCADFPNPLFRCPAR
jgi:hypothetical protein